MIYVALYNEWYDFYVIRQDHDNNLRIFLELHMPMIVLIYDFCQKFWQKTFKLNKDFMEIQ